MIQFVMPGKIEFFPTIGIMLISIENLWFARTNVHAPAVCTSVTSKDCLGDALPRRP